MFPHPPMTFAFIRSRCLGKRVKLLARKVGQFGKELRDLSEEIPQDKEKGPFLRGLSVFSLAGFELY